MDGTDLPNIGKVARRELAAHDMTRLEQFSGASRARLLAIHGVGPKALSIIDQALDEAGLEPMGE